MSRSGGSCLDMIDHGDESGCKSFGDLTISYSVTPGATVCNMCLEEDSPDHSCRGWKCRACLKFDDHTICPYFFYIPKGADFNRRSYEITCACGNLFNEDRWSCTDCPSTGAVIRHKACTICHGSGHATYECSVDKVRSAKIRLSMEKELAEIPTFVTVDTADFDCSDFGLEEDNYAPLSRENFLSSALKAEDHPKHITALGCRSLDMNTLRHKHRLTSVL